jgi:hypothetical protein
MLLRPFKGGETILQHRRSHFPALRKQPETEACYQGTLIKQRGSIMWDIIISLIYHRSCRKYLAAARKQRELWA